MLNHNSSKQDKYKVLLSMSSVRYRGSMQFEIVGSAIKIYLYENGGILIHDELNAFICYKLEDYWNNFPALFKYQISFHLDQF